MTDCDELYMRRAIELAARGRGGVEPNPMVGAVVVQDGEVVGEGYHAVHGGPHAEVVALDAAGARAKGATIYVTLEPCCHHGKTPPCTDGILRSQFARVVVATIDPFPEVAGRGIEILRAAGIPVDVGCLEGEARRLNAPYFKLIQRGRPYVVAKWAMSLDGRIATSTGESKWISGEASRRHANQYRGLIDAIVVGVETVLADDPLLTARPPGPRRATRVVLDSKCRTPCDSQLVRTAREVPTIIATTSRSSADRLVALGNAGCEVLVLAADEAGRVSIDALLEELGQRRFTNVLVEGGGQVVGGFLDAGEIDAVHAYIAPCVIGGTGAKPSVAGRGFERIADVLRLEIAPPVSLPPDVFLETRRAIP